MCTWCQVVSYIHGIIPRGYICQKYKIGFQNYTDFISVASIILFQCRLLFSYPSSAINTQTSKVIKLNICRYWVNHIWLIVMKPCYRMLIFSIKVFLDVMIIYNSCLCLYVMCTYSPFPNMASDYLLSAPRFTQILWCTCNLCVCLCIMWTYSPFSKIASDWLLFASSFIQMLWYTYNSCASLYIM